MTAPSTPPSIELIPVDRIVVVNPRVRNKKIFKEIVANIAELGLKRPITVTYRDAPEGPRYDLVCGQGRLEAYRALGQQEIPALVVEANSDDCMVMSLVENLARRQHRAIDLLHDIKGLKRRGSPSGFGFPVLFFMLSCKSNSATDRVSNSSQSAGLECADLRAFEAYRRVLRPRDKRH